jgi:hypothetical protein
MFRLKDQSIPDSILPQFSVATKAVLIQLISKQQWHQPNKAVRLMGKMRNGNTATKSMTTSANSCHGGATIDNGDGRTYKWWHGEQQMHQLTEEWGHCNQSICRL